MAINPDRILAARRKIAEEPYDVDSWFLLLKHAQQRNITEARSVNPFEVNLKNWSTLNSLHEWVFFD